MLSMNGRISRDPSRVDTPWLERPELNIGDAFNWQISGGEECIDWSHVRLSEERSRDVKELEGEGKCF